MEQDTIRILHDLADTCITLSKSERPELAWLKSRHAQVQTQYHLKTKGETDSFLYERMYGQPPQKPSDILKLRYWRTGKCTPGNREQCLLYGNALKLSAEESEYLIQNYYDRNLEVYLPCVSNDSPLYLARLERMNILTASYLSRIPDTRLERLNISSPRKAHYLRHLYFTDAFHYVHMPQIQEEVLTKHITSSRYDSEFTRQFKLLGETPRKTMIRHLLILGLPELTLEQINEHLQFFGYLPLDKSHSMPGGERLDWLLIRLLELYERKCAFLSAKDRLSWFQEASRILDAHFAGSGNPRLRFMYFKALDL